MSNIATTLSEELNHPYHAAYVATAADRDALDPSELIAVNLDVPVAVATVLGAMPKMQSVRAAIIDTFGPEIAKDLDKAEIYARALGYAHTVYLAASAPAEVLPELAERAMKFRNTLLSDAKALANRGLLDARPLAELKGGPGYLNIAYDLGVLVRMLRERWTTIASKSAITPEEIDEAEHVFAQITDAYAQRSRQSDQVSATANERVRAFTLLVNTYDQVRRLATYMRWKTDDAEKFAVSLWAGRGTRTDLRPKADPPAADPAPALVAAPPPPLPPAATVPSGLPGSSPFADN